LTRKVIFFKQYFREGELHVFYTMFVTPFVASIWSRWHFHHFATHCVKCMSGDGWQRCWELVQ